MQKLSCSILISSHQLSARLRSSWRFEVRSSSRNRVRSLLKWPRNVSKQANLFCFLFFSITGIDWPDFDGYRASIFHMKIQLKTKTPLWSFTLRPDRNKSFQDSDDHFVVFLTKDRNLISMLPNFSLQIAFLPGESWASLTKNFHYFFSNHMQYLEKNFEL